jgi:hypothetical protein
MKRKDFPRPNWIILYLLTFLYLGAFWLENQGTFSKGGQIWLESALTLVYFGLVLVWLSANEQALWLEEQRKRATSRQPQAPESGVFPGQAKRLEIPNNGNRHSGHSLLQKTGRAIFTWLVALVSYLGDFFHSLR